MGRWRDAPTLSFSAIYSSSSTQSPSLSSNLPTSLGFISHHWHLTFSSLCPSFLHWCQFASCYLSLGLPSKAQGIFSLFIFFSFCSSNSFMFYLFQFIWVFTIYLNIAREVCVMEAIKLEITKNYCVMCGEG